MEVHSFKKDFVAGTSQNNVVLRIGGQKFPRLAADCLEIVAIQLFGGDGGITRVSGFLFCLCVVY